jgi:hypothetical protein
MICSEFLQLLCDDDVGRLMVLVTIYREGIFPRHRNIGKEFSTVRYIWKFIGSYFLSWSVSSPSRVPNSMLFLLKKLNAFQLQCLCCLPAAAGSLLDLFPARHEVLYTMLHGRDLSHGQSLLRTIYLNKLFSIEREMKVRVWLQKRGSQPSMGRAWPGLL